jgi:carboxylesterase
LSAAPFVAAGAAALATARWWYPRAVERASAERLPRGPDGIIVGAEPIVFDAPGTRGVLVLHGFGDTPQSVRSLATALHARGYSVRAPLLAGHGRTIGEFARSGGATWMAAAREAWDELRARCGQAFLVGQSLGGALAVLLAADLPPRAMVLLVPYLEMPSAARRIAPVAGALELVVPYLTTRDQRSIHDPVARAASLSFSATTPRLTAELLALTDRARARLPALRVPTLYLQAREDNRIAPAAAERSFASLGAVEKRLLWIEDSGHVLAADSERDRVAGLVGEWLDAR